MLANGYLKRFIIDSSKHKWSPQQSAASAPEDVKSFCVPPYVQGTTAPIKRVLNNYNIKVALKPQQTIINLFPKPEDPSPKDQARGVIPFRAKIATNSTSGRPNGNAILDSENIKKQSNKNILINLRSRNILCNLVTLSRRNRPQYYVLTQVGEPDAS